MNLNTLASCLALSAIPGFASAQLINGSFEDPALTPGSAQFVTSATLTGWDLSGSSFLVSNGYNGSGVSWNLTSDGTQDLYINPFVADGQTASQTVSLVAGANTVSFTQADFGTTFVSPGGQVNVSVTRTSDSLIVVGPTLFTTPDFSGFISQSLSFTAPTSESYRVTFSSVSGHAGLIDNVQVNAVPEPASMMVLGLGLAGILRSKKKIKR